MLPLAGKKPMWTSDTLGLKGRRLHVIYLKTTFKCYLNFHVKVFRQHFLLYFFFPAFYFLSPAISFFSRLFYFFSLCFLLFSRNFLPFSQPLLSFSRLFLLFLAFYFCLTFTLFPQIIMTSNFSLLLIRTCLEVRNIIKTTINGRENK